MGWIKRDWKIAIGWLFLSLLLISSPGVAQSGKGVIRGTVTDDSGGVLKGARV